ncbi:GID complex subunit containing RING finger motif [Basidiobolus ranarum]|uniref:GID complex subunit containing RING finger motif n=1 Tax=Basidiobolus ranarum TaxID=34480 RepID=A0ABR2W8A3_9FUNG
MNKINHEALLTVEQPFIKVPYEQLKKAFRISQKHIEKETTVLTHAISDLLKSANQNKIDAEEAVKVIDSSIQRLKTLKKKLQDAKQEEFLFTQRSKTRLQHLSELNQVLSYNDEAYTRWSRIRLDRVLVDFMLRSGYSETAKALAKDANIEELVDTELFIQSKKIEEALQKHSCTECLHWCSENKTSLRKMKSTLEFNLRLQEFIELVRTRRTSDAITYARKYLIQWTDVNIKEIQQAMALLAFKPDTKCQPYKKLFDENRWEHLMDQFRNDNFSLHSLTSEPLLSVTLQTGLSALKTPMCYQPENRNINCPVCAPETLGVLAEKLPLSHHVNSTIVCRISGDIMNENNPPMALPNGYVYSFNALKEAAAKNQGKIKCPRTNDTFEFSELKKVFLT